MKKGQTQRGVSNKQQALQLLRNNDLTGAATVLGRVCKNNPADHEAWLLQSVVARQRGQHDAAIRYCQTALAYNHRHAQAHNQLGLLYRDKGMFREAIACFHSVLEIAPRAMEGHINLADTLLADNRDDELIVACRNALHLYPGDAEIRCKLAIALERSHQLEAARSEAAEVMRIAPEHARAALTMAKIEKRSGNLEIARGKLEHLCDAKLTPPQLSAVLSELGDVLDRMGEYPAAHAAFLASNRAIMKMAESMHLNRNTIFNLVNHYRKVFTIDFTRGWTEAEPDDGIPSPIFLVGFPRSGTTLTEQIITASGGIIPTDEKPAISRLIGEIASVLGRNFVYPDGLNSLSTTELSILRQHYWNLIGEMVQTDIGNNRLLDKLPLNLLEITFIYRLFPSAPSVIVLRDPRDCCLSAFMRGFVPNAAMINCSELEQAARFYAAVMGYWLHIRTCINIPYMEIRYEDLIGDLEGTARPLISHIGGVWNDSVLSFYKHTRKHSVRTPSYSDIAKPVFHRAMGRWRNYEPYMAQALTILRPYIKELGYSE